MPEIGGSYLLSLAVPGADNSTSATLTVTDPLGAVTNPPASTVSGSTTAWEAVYTPIAAVGWHVVRWTVTGTGQGVKSSRFYVTPALEGFGVWPPSLADLKLDRGDADDQDDSKDDRMSMVLDAVIAHVRHIKADIYDVAAEEQSGLMLPPPGANIVLGTIRLALRLHARRSTWDNLAQSAGQLGPHIVPSYDSDIERLLQVGRFTRPQDGFA